LTLGCGNSIKGTEKIQGKLDKRGKTSGKTPWLKGSTGSLHEKTKEVGPRRNRVRKKMCQKKKNGLKKT